MSDFCTHLDVLQDDPVAGYTRWAKYKFKQLHKRASGGAGYWWWDFSEVCDVSYESESSEEQATDTDIAWTGVTRRAREYVPEQTVLPPMAPVTAYTL